MKRKFEFIIGLFALLSVVYKLIQCPNCEDSILWFKVSGWVYILFWAIIAVIIFVEVYRENYVKVDKN